MRINVFGLWLILLCGACTSTYDHKGQTPLVELDGKFLYREDLQSVLPAGLSGKDSLAFAEDYIRNWAEETLLYDKAQSNIPNSAEVDRLVENYRKALIMHTYQQELIHQQLSEEISEEELTDYYEKNQSLFTLEQPLLKGLFIKVPLKAPQLANVRRWYKDDSQEAVERLEKYSLQHAVKYEYFYDKWLPASEVVGMLPLKSTDAETFLLKNRQVELKDTAFHYFLHVTDYRGSGEQEPFEFARMQVKEILLNMKQVEFMQQVKSDLYQRAQKSERIKYLDIENTK
ncbi:MAG: peptidyl-prolyl cis-trans isomerase [Bacteroides sp.]|nr:peptidyl-prolyl cis-trans isomerase [Bacteroides sp.]